MVRSGTQSGPKSGGRGVGGMTTFGKSSSNSHGASDEVVASLNKQITELRASVDGVEKERDFYFNKLRDIEVMVGQRESEASGLVKDIQQILYSTEVN